MNDFTKEELIKIIEVMKPPLWFYDISNCELIKKIQSMIESYCEHEWHTNPYNFVLHCQKCGETTNSDSQGKIMNDPLMDSAE